VFYWCLRGRGVCCILEKVFFVVVKKEKRGVVFLGSFLFALNVFFYINLVSPLYLSRYFSVLSHYFFCSISL
jgi:hypothetical protein